MLVARLLFLLFILPIGHEAHVVRRIPVVSIALIVINIIIGLFTFPKFKIEEQIEEIEQEIKRIKVWVFLKYVLKQEDYDLEELYKAYGRYSKELETSWQDFLNGKLGTKEDEPYRERFLYLESKKAELEKKSPYRKFGFNPTSVKPWSVVSHAFLHLGWLHLIANMFFLFFVGPSLEDNWGRTVFAIFYLLAAIFSALTHWMVFPNWDEYGCGASGAVAGVMGAFTIRFARTKIALLIATPVPRGQTTIRVPAYVFFGLWLLGQLWGGILQKSAPALFNVAYWSHIGGFVFGALVASLLKFTGLEKQYITPKIEEKVSPEMRLDSRLVRAMELSDAGEHRKAIVLLENYLANNPSSKVAQIERIKNYLEIGQLPTDAEDVLSMLLALPEHVKDVVALYLKALEIKPDLRLDSHAMFTVFRSLESDKDFVNAKRVFEIILSAFAKDPLIPDLFLRMAKLAKAVGEWSYARQLLNDMIVRFSDPNIVNKVQKELEKIPNA